MSTERRRLCFETRSTSSITPRRGLPETQKTSTLETRRYDSIPSAAFTFRSAIPTASPQVYDLDSLPINQQTRPSDLFRALSTCRTSPAVRLPTLSNAARVIGTARRTSIMALAPRAQYLPSAGNVQVVAVKAVVKSSTVSICKIRATISTLKQISSIWIGLFLSAREEGSYAIYHYDGNEAEPQMARRLSNEAKAQELASLREQQNALDAELERMTAEREVYEVEWTLSGTSWAILEREMSGANFESKRPARPKGQQHHHQSQLNKRLTKGPFLVGTNGYVSEVFHLFGRLPAEVRGIVYEFAIPSEYVSLRSTAYHRFEKVVAPAWTDLAYVSRLISSEARDTIFKRHRIIVNVNLGTTENNIINTYQLPAHVLPLVRHLVLVIDCTRVPSIAHLYQNDWRFFQHLTNLRSLRLCMLHLRKSTPRLIQDRPRICTKVMEDILRRVPDTCNIVFGTGDPAVKDHVEDMKAKCAKRQGTEPVHWVPTYLAHVMEVPRAELRTAHAELEVDVTLKRGIMHGRMEDLRSERRHRQAWAELHFAGSL